MHQRRLAFTLIELLVVISIIALLIAILLPVLGVARAEAIASSELASGRQLQQAHLSQAYENKGDLLPGAGSSSGAVRNHLGNTVGGAEAQRYPWRIAAHLDGNLEGTLLFNGSERVLDSDETESAINYTVSIAPGYGYNAQYVGGRSGTGPTLAVKDIDRAKHPSNLIAFGSAHRPQIEPTVIGNIVGHEQIFAPTGVNALTSSFAPQAAWDAEYDIDAMGSAHGYIHARHNGSAVFTFLDGHAQRLSPDDVRDMRMWSNQAAIANDPNWTP